MELWIPNVVDVKQVEEIINKWLEKDKLARPYQHLIQQRIHSTWPQLHLHQTLYIGCVNNKILNLSVPVEKEGEVPYKVQLCSICHEENAVVRMTLPCNHAFHVHCISKWFKLGNTTCPLCRMDCKNYY